MRTIRYILGMLLAMTCGMQAYAQTIEDGEAFYIYRNDGDFNGFFYDEVLDMRYSKIGLDSVEYDSYVVQEVETADSIYRIPLCAIDSIGFVQPKILFNPKLKIMEDLGMNEYLIDRGCSASGVNLLDFSLETPANLLPKVGDVLVNTTWKWWDDDIHSYEYGFAGKVTKVSNDGQLYHVDAAPIESLGEVFKQFITTEKLTTDSNGNSVRRMAGLRTIGSDAGDFGFNFLNLSGTLTREYNHGEHTNLAITIDYGVKVDVKVTYDITVDHIFIKLGLDEDLSAQAGFSGTLSGTWEPDISILPDWIGAIKFPACLPLFETNALPKTFFRIGGSVCVKSTLPSINLKAHQMVIITDRYTNWINASANSNLRSGYGEDDNLFQPGESKLTFDGFVQAGIKFDNKIKTNGWVKKVFQAGIGLETYAGPKLSGNIDISLPDVINGQIDPSTITSSITFNPCVADMEAKANVNFWGYPEQSVKFAEGSLRVFKDNTRYAFPEFTKFEVSQDEKKSTANIEMSWNKDVFTTEKIGVAIHKVDPTLPNSLGEEVDRSPMKHHFKGKGDMQYTPHLKPGEYYAVPIISLFSKDVEVKSKKQLISILPQLEVSVKELELPAFGNTPEDSVTAVITYTTDFPAEVWVDARGCHFTHDATKKTITIRVEPNQGLAYHKGHLEIKWAACYEDFFYEERVGRILIPWHQDIDTNIKAIKFQFASAYSHYKQIDERSSYNSNYKNNENVGIHYFYWGDYNTEGLLPCKVTRHGNTLHLYGELTEHPEFYGGNTTIETKLDVILVIQEDRTYIEKFIYDYNSYCDWKEYSNDRTPQSCSRHVEINVSQVDYYTSFPERSNYFGFSVPQEDVTAFTIRSSFGEYESDNEGNKHTYMVYTNIDKIDTDGPDSRGSAVFGIFR